MRGTSSSVLVSLSLLSLASALTINTPATLIQCHPVSISFFGGQPPYYISVIPGNQPSATPLEQFPLQGADGSLTWVVDIASGTSVGLAITDQTGATAYDAAQTIMAGTDSSCLGLSNPTSGGAVQASNPSSGSSKPKSSAKAGATSKDTHSTAIVSSAIVTSVRPTPLAQTSAAPVLQPLSSVSSVSTSSTASASPTTAKSGTPVRISPNAVWMAVAAIVGGVVSML